MRLFLFIIYILIVGCVSKPTAPPPSVRYVQALEEALDIAMAQADFWRQNYYDLSGDPTGDGEIEAEEDFQIQKQMEWGCDCND